MGVATGVTMEFQFGTNWAYYSQYVGDVFGAPLAIEGLMAFFLEATFIGLFFFGWNKLSRGQHLIVTWLLALGASFSALWILIANGWMQHPVGAHFNFHTMRMEMYDFYSVIFNEVAQAKFVHTIASGYVAGSMFILSISAWFLLRGRNIPFAKRSMTVAAAFTLIGIPDQQTHTTRYAVQIPWLLGLVATRSFHSPVQGIRDLVIEAHDRIQSGILAYNALSALQVDPTDKHAEEMLDANQSNIGYGLLLKRYTDDVARASPELIDKAAWDTVPDGLSLFWSFRIMVVCGMYFIFLFALAFYFSQRRRLLKHRWFLWLAFLSLPLPWVAIEVGWWVAEYGRQPWVVEGLLPTFMGVSSVSATNVWISLLGFVFFYSILAVVEMYLMVKYIRLGPEKLFSVSDFSAMPLKNRV